MSRSAAWLLSALFLFFLVGVTISIFPIEFFGGVIIKTMLIALNIVIGYATVSDMIKYSSGDTRLVNYNEKDYYGCLKFMYSSNTGDYQVKMRTWVIGILAAVSIMLLIGLSGHVFRGSVFVYNSTKVYKNEYVKKVQEKVGFYDKMWKTYSQKDKISGINKEAFLEVTKVIFEARKDGEKTAWKWVSENQNVPYEEFTKFYADLSNFIETQRKEYFEIEKSCQNIANSNNTLLDTFPNNLYNKFLKCERINFEYGFTSDSTQNVFSRKKE